jgi:hypothetical protein
MRPRVTVARGVGSGIMWPGFALGRELCHAACAPRRRSAAAPHAGRCWQRPAPASAARRASPPADRHHNWLLRVLAKLKDVIQNLATSGNDLRWWNKPSISPEGDDQLISLQIDANEQSHIAFPRLSSGLSRKVGNRAVVYTTGTTHFGTFRDVSGKRPELRKCLILLCFLLFSGEGENRWVSISRPMHSATLPPLRPRSV